MVKSLNKKELETYQGKRYVWEDSENSENTATDSAFLVQHSR